MIEGKIPILNLEQEGTYGKTVPQKNHGLKASENTLENNTKLIFVPL